MIIKISQTTQVTHCKTVLLNKLQRLNHTPFVCLAHKCVSHAHKNECVVLTYLTQSCVHSAQYFLQCGLPLYHCNTQVAIICKSIFPRLLYLTRVIHMQHGVRSFACLLYMYVMFRLRVLSCWRYLGSGCLLKDSVSDIHGCRTWLSLWSWTGNVRSHISNEWEMHLYTRVHNGPINFVVEYAHTLNV
jgi:hypothetical protein